MSTLIALVAIAVVVDGQRVTLEPGQELPELSKHDRKSLVESGAAMDMDAQAYSEKAEKMAEAVAMRAFKEARQRVLDREDAATSQSTAPAASAVDSTAQTSQVEQTAVADAATTKPATAAKSGKQAKE